MDEGHHVRIKCYDSWAVSVPSPPDVKPFCVLSPWLTLSADLKNPPMILFIAWFHITHTLNYQGYFTHSEPKISQTCWPNLSEVAKREVGVPLCKYWKRCDTFLSRRNVFVYPRWRCFAAKYSTQNMRSASWVSSLVISYISCYGN